jgi:hypothetical protein
MSKKKVVAGPRLGTQVPTIVPKKTGFTRALGQPKRLKAPRHLKGKGHR